MNGLVEWHLTPQFGVQFWAEAEQAGRSTVVLDESDLDGLITTLDRAGIQPRRDAGSDDVEDSAVNRPRRQPRCRHWRFRIGVDTNGRRGRRTYVSMRRIPQSASVARMHTVK